MINVAEEMKQLNKLAKSVPEQIRKPLWKLLINPQWLAQAWEQIRNNKGSQTAGVDGKTAVNVDLELIHKLAEELKNGTYRPKPVRRVLIPKANGKARPLGISTIKDRIVQQAIKMLLEPIFEADFLNCSHGFRQSRSTITALRDVARVYPNISYIVEGDIEGCYDNIPHGKLLELLKNRVADEKILSLIRDFLKAGYLEDWKYHKTYSGVPQGNIVGPLLCNIFLHQLDTYMMENLDANQTQSYNQKNARRNPVYLRLSARLSKLRKKMTNGKENKETIKRIEELERQRRRVPYFLRDKRHPGKIWYVRYADDFLALVAGNKMEAEAVKNKIKTRLAEMGLNLSEDKTRITHWSNGLVFLGYQLQGKLRDKGIGIRAVLSIPRPKIRQIKDSLCKTSNYYHIPEIDVIKQMNDQFRGWCNYYRYANSPQKAFNDIASFMWWRYAHFNAKKHKSSIKAMIVKERKANRLCQVQKNDRKRETFQIKLEKKTLILDKFPPKTCQIREVSNNQTWEVDLKPVTPMNWQSGRSLATYLAALDRADGRCERCKERPIAHVHHTVPIKGRSFIARVTSDRDQRYTAIALCRECHLEAHAGSLKPGKRSS